MNIPYFFDGSQTKTSLNIKKDKQDLPFHETV